MTYIPSSSIAAPSNTETPADRKPSLELVTYSLGSQTQRRRRILVMKLDHFGDFIIGLPALRQLRAAFPQDHIRLICGSWNKAFAAESMVADEIRTYDYFPQNSLGWDGTPVQPLSKFIESASSVWDLAIDLRVDGDTRFLLQHVDAAIRCGIGTSGRMPYLDIALPPEHDQRDTTHQIAGSSIFLPADLFKTRLDRRNGFYHEADFSKSNMHVVFGPYIPLPVGRLRASFGVEIGRGFALSRVKLTFEVMRDQSIMVASTIRSAGELAGRGVQDISIEFDNAIAESSYELRIHMQKRAIGGRLRFFGVRVGHLNVLPSARFKPAEIHTGEKLSLLVSLIAERCCPLYEGFARTTRPVNAAIAEILPDIPNRPRRIALAPIGNSDLRNWPLAYWARLIDVILAAGDSTVVLTGSGAQAAELELLAERAADPRRVLNLAGKTSWSDLPQVLTACDIVVCNNSGVAHLAAALGLRTLAIYSASHQPQEWGPRGPRARAVMGVISCSPCGHDSLAECPFDHACMKGIEPVSIAEMIEAMLRDDAVTTVQDVSAPVT